MIKICGITRLEDARHAVEQGADALGFIFWPRSPRHIEPARAAEIIVHVPGSVTTVGVFVNETLDAVRTAVEHARVKAVQLHGDEDPSFAAALTSPFFRSVTLDDAPASLREWPASTTWLLDASDRVKRGGTGTAVDWTAAAAFAREHRVILAGGLTAENVTDAVAIVRPFGVDVSSGVEVAPGVKDPDKVTRFIANARQAFEREAIHR